MLFCAYQQGQKSPVYFCMPNKLVESIQQKPKFKFSANSGCIDELPPQAKLP